MCFCCITNILKHKAQDNNYYYSSPVCRWTAFTELACIAKSPLGALL